MKIIKRRTFIKNIFFSLFTLVSFLTFKQIAKKNDYLGIFLKKINLAKPKNEDVIKTLYKINYKYHKKFISNYKTSKFNSFNEFSFWLNNKITEDYKKNKIILVENTFVSKTEASLLIIKYI